MRARRAMFMALVATVGVWSLTIATSAQGPSRLPMPLEPFGDANEAIYPAFEGWGDTQDGTSYYMVLGYKNRNRSQTVEIPIGPNNRIEPGGPDYGQPTVFEPGRQTTIFAIKVPKDFGAKKLTWTLVANGQPSVVTFFLNPEYNMDLYKVDANGNESPRMKFGLNEPMVSGPTAGFVQTLNASVGQPVPLKMWASDKTATEKNWENIVSAQNRPKPIVPARDQVAIVNGRVLGVPAARTGDPATPPDITVVWKKMRGPVGGVVTVTPRSVPLVTKGDPKVIGEATAVATFSAPGEYVLRAEPIEASDGYDGLCCFSFANIKVTVK